MSHIAYLFHEDVLDDVKRIHEAEDNGSVPASQRLSVIQHNAAKTWWHAHPNQIGRGSFVVHIINGTVHVFTKNRLSVWIEEYLEFLRNNKHASSPPRNDIRSTMGAAKVGVSEILDKNSVAMAMDAIKPSKRTRVPVNILSRPDVGVCSTSIQLFASDTFLEDFARDPVMSANPSESAHPGLYAC
jgi:hypothetical protein